MLSAFKKKHFLKAAIEQTKNARASEGTKAEQLFLSAYGGYAEVVKNDITLAEALYNWGFALLHHAKSSEIKKSLALYKEAIEKFNFCLIIEPNHLGAAIDGGVCYMEIAQIKQVDVDNELYQLANQAFKNAERIQRGSASFNIACIYAIQGNDTACLKQLEASLEYGSLPDYEEIMSDKDLTTLIKKRWFIEFMNPLLLASGIENKDKSAVKYDDEAGVKKNTGNAFKRFPDIESKGQVKSLEGNDIEPKSIKNKPVKFVGVALKSGFNDVQN